jgi:hypothetical protein
MTAETYQAVLRPLSPLHTCPITLCRLAAWDLAYCLLPCSFPSPFLASIICK